MVFEALVERHFRYTTTSNSSDVESAAIDMLYRLQETLKNLKKSEAIDG